MVVLKKNENTPKETSNTGSTTFGRLVFRYSARIAAISKIACPIKRISSLLPNMVPIK